MHLLPPITTYEEFLASARDEATYLPAMREIVDRHRLPGGELRKYDDGSTIVFAVSDTHVVKLFEPIFADTFEVESTILRWLDGKLPVPTPRLIDTGEIERWRYIVMSQLSGVPLAIAWDAIEEETRIALCHDAGAAVAALHALALDDLALPDRWQAFLDRQREVVVDRERKLGLDERWLRQIPDYLRSVDLADTSDARVLLHTEIMREHFLVSDDGGWHLSGLLDFEPSMIGPAGYEFASVGIFLSKGDPDLLRAFLEGYGFTRSEMSAELRRRSLAYTILHRFGHLKRYLEMIPPKHATTLGELAEEWLRVES